MMRVPLDGPAVVKADNQTVIVNASKPESVQKKKSNSIAYHYVREGCAMGVMRIMYENTLTNLADSLTKIQSGPRGKEWCSTSFTEGVVPSRQ